jgi:hypothetical protein
VDAAAVGADPPRPAELRLIALDRARRVRMHVVLGSFDADDFDRAVALVSVEASPRALTERLGFDWEYLEWLAIDASATVLGEHAEGRGLVVSYGGEAFTAGFLIGVHVRAEVSLDADLLARAVDAVQERGRHAVIADHCDLASVARLETVYSDALVESMAVAAEEREALRSPVTRIFEAGLAVGLELGSGGDGAPGPEQP